MSIAEKLLRAKEDLDMVYEKGKDAAKQAFADAFQINGDRTDYNKGFSLGGWNDETFSYIRYPIVCKGTANQATSVFYRCLITHISVPITIEDAPASETFYYAQNLEEISQLVLINVPSFTRTLIGCPKLRHMMVEGSIDVNFTVSSSPELDEETVQSIIDHLKDLTGLTTQTLTFHQTVGEKLTEEQKAVITAKNWTLVY